MLLTIRKRHNLWVRLCNEWQSAVHCVPRLLGEEAILAEHHGTPLCCTKAELQGSHGIPTNWNRIASPLSPYLTSALAQMFDTV